MWSPSPAIDLPAVGWANSPVPVLDDSQIVGSNQMALQALMLHFSALTAQSALEYSNSHRREGKRERVVCLPFPYPHLLQGVSVEKDKYSCNFSDLSRCVVALRGRFADGQLGITAGGRGTGKSRGACHWHTRTGRSSFQWWGLRRQARAPLAGWTMETCWAPRESPKLPPAAPTGPRGCYHRLRRRWGLWGRLSPGTVARRARRRRSCCSCCAPCTRIPHRPRLRAWQCTRWAQDT